MTTLVVFSHPNHELAIFGLLQRIKPRLIYLTDGGGAERVEQTRRGLGRIGLLDNASFLNHSEKSFYEALLDHDLEFFERVAVSVRAALEELQPDRILCDAIEFYNPVHDISLPIVRAALCGVNGREIFEVPLIHQKPDAGEAYAVQRMPASRSTGQIELWLSDVELASKSRARDEIYSALIDQLGWVISELPPSHGALEVIAPACSSIPEHGPDIVLRYEQRARILAEKGEIERPITYHQHYLPIASFLWDLQR